MNIKSKTKHVYITLLTLGLLVTYTLSTSANAQSLYRVTDLGALSRGFDASQAVGINDKGQVVGASLADRYYHAILWAKEKGHTQLDFGHCGPFLNDGILLYKKRWGMRMKRSRTKHRMLFLSVHRLNPYLETFLTNNPLV